MFKRARYQFGYLRRKPRKRNPDVWVWERNAAGPDGRRKRETVIVGTLDQYPTEGQAWRAAESYRVAVNSKQQNEDVLFGKIVRRLVKTPPKPNSNRPRAHASIEKKKAAAGLPF
jgi:hypothetical protein